jgi:hypothetical protein
VNRFWDRDHCARDSGIVRIRTAWFHIDPGQALSDFAEMEHVRVETLVPDRLSATAVSLIALCGLLLTLTVRWAPRTTWRAVKTGIYGIAGGEALAMTGRSRQVTSEVPRSCASGRTTAITTARNAAS